MPFEHAVGHHKSFSKHVTKIRFMTEKGHNDPKTENHMRPHHNYYAPNYDPNPWRQSQAHACAKFWRHNFGKIPPPQRPGAIPRKWVFSISRHL